MTTKGTWVTVNPPGGGEITLTVGENFQDTDLEVTSIQFLTDGGVRVEYGTQNQKEIYRHNQVVGGDR